MRRGRMPLGQRRRPMVTRTPDVDDDSTERIVDIDVSSEMESSFLEYAYSVIYSRALPDARDGLKPVQRRILYTMSEMNLRPDRGHVKSARVVGEVMGRLHPHGDGAIYDALVRMAQPWSMRLPLVDGHGNFGSPDDTNLMVDFYGRVSEQSKYFRFFAPLRCATPSAGWRRAPSGTRCSASQRA